MLNGNDPKSITASWRVENSVVQAAKVKAREFRTFKHFKIMIYLDTGNLNFKNVNPFCQ